MLHHYKDKQPQIDATAYIAHNATIIGDVIIGAQSSIWFQTVIRGDVERTVIGKRVNIQDFCMLHQSPTLPIIIEDDVTVGHQATLHACTIRKNALIGMGSMILDGAEVGEHAFIGAGSLVTPGTVIPPNCLAFGRPARVVRKLTTADKEEMQRIRESYISKGQYYRSLSPLNHPGFKG